MNGRSGAEPEPCNRNRKINPRWALIITDGKTFQKRLTGNQSVTLQVSAETAFAPVFICALVPIIGSVKSVVELNGSGLEFWLMH